MTVFFTILFGGVLAAFAGVTISAWVARSTKISGFRQTWIDELRKDISDCVGAAEKWFRKWKELDDGVLSVERTRREREELFPLANQARVILRRIRLRFNPRANQYKAQDDILLASLADLLNLDKFAPDNPEARWHELADQAVEQAREVLKREWEVTKQLRLPRWSDVRWRDSDSGSDKTDGHRDRQYDS